MRPLVINDDDEILVQDFGQPLAYELAYDVFFAAKKHSFGPNRSYAHNIKTYHDKYGYKSPLVAFVTFIPIEALAMCFTAVRCLNKVVVFSDALFSSNTPSRCGGTAITRNANSAITWLLTGTLWPCCT